MSKVKVITDSDSSLSVAIAAKYDIDLVPITIQFGQESFTTNIDIDDKLLFEKIDASGKLPTTAAPSPGAFVESFKKAFDNGAESIICICVSSKVSSTYDSAVLATKEFSTKKISVIDAKYISLGQGFLALAAAESLLKGSSHEQTVITVKEMIPHLSTFASFNTLKYLVMGGRVSKFSAGMAGALDIRPLLTMKDGTLQMLEKVRTRKAAMERLVNLICKDVHGKKIEKFGIFHINNEADAIVLRDTLRERLDLPEGILFVPFTPGLSVHAGAGMIGAAIYAK
jgi:DegV family protein with EDD domain